jgi:hypothetical protein
MLIGSWAEAKSPSHSLSIPVPCAGFDTAELVSENKAGTSRVISIH